jgi:hypothetical protein
MVLYPPPANSTRPLCESVTLEALGRLLPRDLVDTVLQETGRTTQRRRKLDLPLTVYLVVAMGLFTRMSIPHVLRLLLHALRLDAATPTTVASGAAVVYRRAQLGARPLVALFRRCCQPLATPDTPGAFLGRYRLMALDGTVEDVPDTSANARVFGRTASQHGPSPYPQVRCLYLAECGTHAIIDAGVWPVRVSEHTGARRLVRRLTPEMLVLWDRGLHSVALITRVRAQGAHVLGRLPATVRVQATAICPDGSYQARLGPHTVRIIEFVLPHPTDPSRDRVYRLVTTLLDWQAYPAQALAEAYCARWEIEGVLDELTVHQRLAHQPLRSQTPVGVVQELYGLLLAHYAIRTAMAQAAAPQQVAPTRISFVHAVRTVQRYLPDLQRATPAQAARWYQRMVAEVGEEVLPPRRPRYYPRLLKRHHNRYPLRSPTNLATDHAQRVRREPLLI